MLKSNGVVHLRTDKKGKIFTTATAPNGRKLYPTEGFTHKASAWTNIKSVMKLFGGSFVLVQDNSTSPAKIFKLTLKSKTEVSGVKPFKIPK